jgi:hypothetical protein
VATTPGRTAAAAAAFYAAFTITALAQHGWNPLWFVWIGERYASGVPSGRTGYDGQFVYYIARDGWAAAPHLDNPPYRFQRIVYPGLVRVLSGGDPAAVAWLMLAVNYAAIVVTTWLLARWLRDHRQPLWYGLAYPLFVGTFLAYSRDLTEPLAYGLAAAALLLWLSERRPAALILFAAAGLARETTLLFAAGAALAELASRRPGRVLALACTALPLLVWQLLLAARFGGMPLGPATGLHALPLWGALPHLSLEPGRVSALLFIGLPSLLLFPLALRWTWRDPRNPVGWVLALHCLLTLSLSDESYAHLMGVARVSLGVILALVLAAPALAPAARIAVALWAGAPTLVWLVPVLRWAPWTARF